MKCSLCNSPTVIFLKSNFKEYFQCENCEAILLNSNNYPSPSEEVLRYKEHNNDVNDIRYQKFVCPIVNAVQQDFDSTKSGLDFGCGTGPVITKLLRDKSYPITTYDPFFDNKPEVLKTNYDFIVCCEVIEHFHNPLKEFKLLKSLLKPNGKLYCMTDLFSKNIDFEKWYYKDDNTHVIFYHQNTFDWIKENISFSKVVVNNRLITLEV